MLRAITAQPMLLAVLLSIPQAVTAAEAFPFHPSGFAAPPRSGHAAATQFSIGSEFGTGTSCGVRGVSGVSADPSITGTNQGAGKGPGLLYAAINELGFGSHANAGPACGLCYELTPLDQNGAPQSNRALTFMIVDMCPAVTTDGRRQPGCGVCSISDHNSLGNQWSFDIASDAMSADQYLKFFGGQPGDDHYTNVNSLSFQQKSCDTTGVNSVPTNVNPPQGPNNTGGSCIKTDGSCAAGSSAGVCASNANRLMAMSRKRSSRYEGYQE